MSKIFRHVVSLTTIRAAKLMTTYWHVVHNDNIIDKSAVVVEEKWTLVSQMASLVTL